MRHQNAGRKFSRNSAHRKAMFRNMVTSVIEHERITTTDPKAKELRRLVERTITIALRLGDVLTKPRDQRTAAEQGKYVHALRMAGRMIRTREALHKLFDHVAPRLVGRPGGYTRILKVGTRPGDAAPLAILELVTYQLPSVAPATSGATGATATGAEFQFTAFALKASGWEHLEVTDTDGMIWRNGTAGVTIGSAAARTSFDIGTNAGPPSGDFWTGALPSGNDNWSVADNWQDISVPTPADTVVFNATDPGGRSQVDPAFQGAIAGLVDTGEAAHTLEYQRTLEVKGPVSVHTANTEGTGALSILNTQVTLHLTDLNVGINAVGSGTANGYLLLNSGAVIDAKDVGRFYVAVGSMGASNGSVRFANNSKLTLGSTDAPADLLIGYNSTRWPDSGGNHVGVFDASNDTATVNLVLDELGVGESNGLGAATGTLRWNQTEAIDANVIYFGYGSGATGNLDVAAGGRLSLGTSADPIGRLAIGTGNGTAHLDFSVTDPFFTAYLGALDIGTGWTGSADGLLKLGSNSQLNLGTTATLANLTIGYNSTNWPDSGGNHIGVFDASNASATVNLALDNLGVGESNGLGKATGICFLGQDVTGSVTTVVIGSGAGATGFVDILGGSLHATTLTLASGTLDLNANPLTIGATGTLNAQTLDLTGGLLTGQTVSITDGTFNFSGGVVSVDTFTGLLDQNGGVLAPGNSVGQTTVNGNYDLASAGTVKIEIFGSTFNTTTKLYDRLAVNGTVNLNGDSNVGGGGTLDVDLGYSPTVGSSFTILANDGTDAVSGRFKGLLEGATFTSAYGSQTVTFQISYSGGTGNDIVLTVTGKTGAAPTGLTVNGTADNDLLSGSVGADTFTGLAGNDIFTGGAGNDLFVFAAGCGFDRINDFSPGSDDIQLSLALAANFAALDSNGNSVLDDADASVIVAGSDTILLFGSDQIDIVGQTALHSTDFVFV